MTIKTDHAIVRNGQMYRVEIESVFKGFAGVKEAKIIDQERLGADFEVAFRPTQMRIRPSRSSRMEISGILYKILEMKRSATARGFYVALVRQL